MPRHDTIEIGDTYTEISNADVTKFSCQNLHSSGVWINVRAGTGAVTDAGALYLPPHAALLDTVIADIFPGVTGANRVYARTVEFNGDVMISHA